jgi:hypothetical protein
VARGKGHVQAEVVRPAAVRTELRRSQFLLELAFAERVLLEVRQGVTEVLDIRGHGVEGTDSSFDPRRSRLIRDASNELCGRAQIMNRSEKR